MPLNILIFILLIIINQGMMTGQIIGGNSPQQAAMYQLVAMFMILCANAFSVVLVCYLALSTLVSKDGMLATRLIQKRSPADMTRLRLSVSPSISLYLPLPPSTST